MVINGIRTRARHGCDYRIVMWIVVQCCPEQREVIQEIAGLLLHPGETGCLHRGHQQSYTWPTSVFINSVAKFLWGACQVQSPKHF